MAENEATMLREQLRKLNQTLDEVKGTLMAARTAHAVAEQEAASRLEAAEFVPFHRTELYLINADGAEHSREISQHCDAAEQRLFLPSVFVETSHKCNDRVFTDHKDAGW